MLFVVWVYGASGCLCNLDVKCGDAGEAGQELEGPQCEVNQMIISSFRLLAVLCV